MKTDRLLAETIYLLQRGRVTSRQMAERFEVSRRTILRDMDALSLAGIPVTSLDGAGGGYQIRTCKARSKSFSRWKRKAAPSRSRSIFRC